MGCFSWLDCKDNSQIKVGEFKKVYFLIPKKFGGGHIVEHAYDGDGLFGMNDAYAMMARWNSPRACCGDDDIDREIGIDLEDEGTAKYPIKITHDEKAVYEDCKASEIDPRQGL